ncbi:MAG: 50S ribosomal protein L35 [bacterium]|nr:50S ribosomal protein L35 [bacterium]
MKTNKSLTKRLKLTRRGKILARKSGQNHFNAKSSRGKQLAGKRARPIIMSQRNRRRFLPGS